MMEDQAPLIPLALWGLNLSERAGRVELAMMNQANLGNVLTASGHHRLARRHVQAAVTAAGQTTDPVAITWTQIVASLHWLGVGDWPALDAGSRGCWRRGTGPGCAGPRIRWPSSVPSAAT